MSFSTLDLLSSRVLSWWPSASLGTTHSRLKLSLFTRDFFPSASLCGAQLCEGTPGPSHLLPVQGTRDALRSPSLPLASPPIRPCGRSQGSLRLAPDSPRLLPPRWPWPPGAPSQVMPLAFPSTMAAALCAAAGAARLPPPPLSGLQRLPATLRWKPTSLHGPPDLSDRDPALHCPFNFSFWRTPAPSGPSASVQRWLPPHPSNLSIIVTATDRPPLTPVSLHLQCHKCHFTALPQ